MSEGKKKKGKAPVCFQALELLLLVIRDRKKLQTGSLTYRVITRKSLYLSCRFSI